jgi:orotidine 5'-phosphate decarboxylase subfamily 1
MRTLESAAERARSLVQRHWQGLLRVRERLRLSEEAFHLLLASGVGVIGGLINLVFFLAIEQAQSLALQHTGDLAEVAEECGLRGLVCSPLELVALRQVVGDDVVLVTPGIREGDSAADDQRRTLTARQAVEAGAHWLVIGRPIYGASDPRAAAERILASLPRR